MRMAAELKAVLERHEGILKSVDDGIGQLLRRSPENRIPADDGGKGLHNLCDDDKC